MAVEHYCLSVSIATFNDSGSNVGIVQPYIAFFFGILVRECYSTPYVGMSGQRSLNSTKYKLS